MGILKLQLGRENAISGEVASITVDESGQYGPQYLVTFTTGDTMYQNVAPFDRQCQFHKTSPDELVGKELTFWRKPMPNDPTGTKGYFNIEFGLSGAPVSQVRQAAMAGDYVGADLKARGVPVTVPTLDEMVQRYQECLGRAMALTDDFSETFERTFTMSEVKDIATTLFIERNKRGV